MSSHINAAGIALLKQFEGCKLVAYPDPGTGGGPWTIGYGHTGDDVTQSTTWTQRQCDAALVSDLAKFEDAVTDMVNTTITDNQFSALVVLCYNIGVNNLSSSTLLADVNANKLGSAAAQFAVWNRAAGKVMPGLAARRAAERTLFTS